MRKFIVIVISVIVICVSLCGCESWERAGKTIKSDFTGGLERTVTLYSNTGEIIQSWTGKFDIAEKEYEVMFDIDGQRVIIRGGIVVCEENK